MHGTKLGAAALLAGAVILCGSTTATAAPLPIDAASSGFGIDAAAPVLSGVTTQLVGSVGAPLAVVNTVCPAPWANQGVDIYQNYLACVTSPVSG